MLWQKLAHYSFLPLPRCSQCRDSIHIRYRVVWTACVCCTSRMYCPGFFARILVPNRMTSPGIILSKWYVQYEDINVRWGDVPSTSVLLNEVGIACPGWLAQSVSQTRMTSQRCRMSSTVFKCYTDSDQGVLTFMSALLDEVGITCPGLLAQSVYHTRIPSQRCRMSSSVLKCLVSFWKGGTNDLTKYHRTVWTSLELSKSFNWYRTMIGRGNSR